MRTMNADTILHRSAARSERGARRALRWLGLLWESPIIAGLLSLAIYATIALQHGPVTQAGPNAYFNYLADAFLHRQTHLRIVPPSQHDLSLFDGKYYLYWGPFPAVLLMPFVALFGVTFSDIIFTFTIAAFNVALVALMLRYACRRRVIGLSRERRGLFVLFFALGTVHITLIPFGRVWFTGQLVAFWCVALAYLAALALHRWPAFLFTGLAVALAMLTRNHLLFTGLWPAIHLLYQHRSEGRRRLLAYTAAGLLPVIIAIGLLGAYNWVRFGSALDNGLAYHQMGTTFAGDYERYGAFNPHYVPTNLYYQYLANPYPLRPETTLMGGSLFLMSPVFSAAFWGLYIGRPRWSTWTLAATILLVAIPILLLMGTGFGQFGPRYTLDFTVPLLLLTALGARRWPMWLLIVLIVAAIAQYVTGTLWLASL